MVYRPWVGDHPRPEVLADGLVGREREQLTSFYAFHGISSRKGGGDAGPS